MIRPAFRTLSALLLAAASLSAPAAVTRFSDRALFSAQGSIAFNSGFEDIDTASAGGLFFTGDPWTRNGVTYTSGSNLVIGPALGLGLASNMLSSNSSQPGGLVSGVVGGAYDLFGFDLASVLAGSAVDLSLSTNAATYSFSNLSAPAVPATAFVGFRAGAGEFFTGFSLRNTTNGGVPAIDNVTLGTATVSPIPEPGQVAMLLAGLSLLGLRARRG